MGGDRFKHTVRERGNVGLKGKWCERGGEYVKSGDGGNYSGVNLPSERDE